MVDLKKMFIFVVIISFCVSSVTANANKNTDSTKSNRNIIETQDDITGKIDEKEIVAFTTRLYEVILDRDPDPSGVDYWSTELINDKTATFVAKQLFFSPELKEQNLSNGEYVIRLYKTLLNREPDQGGFEYWIDQLENKGRLIEQLFYGFAFSEEFRLLSKNSGINAYDDKDQLIAFIERFYNLTLGRSADAQGLNFWYKKLSSGELSPYDIANYFLLSDELKSRNLNYEDFITIAYRSLLDREPDDGGKLAWIGELENGTSKNAIINGFIGSEEFYNNVVLKFISDEENDSIIEDIYHGIWYEKDKDKQFVQYIYDDKVKTFLMQDVKECVFVREIDAKTNNAMFKDEEVKLDNNDLIFPNTVFVKAEEDMQNRITTLCGAY